MRYFLPGFKVDYLGIGLTIFVFSSERRHPDSCGRQQFDWTKPRPGSGHPEVHHPQHKGRNYRGGRA